MIAEKAQGARAEFFSRDRVPLYLCWAVYGTLLLVVVLGWAVYAFHQPSLLEYAYRYDFLNVYVGTRAVVTGQGGQVYDLALQRALTGAAIAPFERPLLLPYTYPGYVAVLLAPLGALSYAAAFAVWGGLNLLMAGWTIGRLALTTGRTRGERLALFCVAASFAPLLLGLLQGQFQIVVLLGLVEAVLALRAGREGRAGAWLLLGLIKPHLILLPLLALALARRPRALAIWGAGTLLILALSFAVLGNWLPPYLGLLLEFTRQGETLGNYPIVMANWRGLLTGLLGTDRSLPALGLLGGLDALSVLLLVRMARVTARQGAEPPAPDLGEVYLAAAILLGLLVSPHLYLHDTVPALVAGCLFWRAAQPALAPAAGGGAPRAPRLRLVSWLLGGGPLVAYLALLWPPGQWGIQVGAWYLVILLLAVAWAWPLLLGKGQVARDRV